MIETELNLDVFIIGGSGYMLLINDALGCGQLQHEINKEIFSPLIKGAELNRLKVRLDESIEDDSVFDNICEEYL